MLLEHAPEWHNTSMDMTFPKIQKYYQYALFLSIFTIVANLVEGFASTVLGYADETLVLFGFGIDSFIEVISAIGITMMILRLAGSSKDQRTTIENLALRVTAISFYLLTAGLFITVLINLYFRQTPASTRWGVVISIISLSGMFILMKLKLRVGGELNSAPIMLMRIAPVPVSICHWYSWDPVYYSALRKSHTWIVSEQSALLSIPIRKVMKRGKKRREIPTAIVIR